MLFGVSGLLLLVLVIYRRELKAVECPTRVGVYGIYIKGLGSRSMGVDLSLEASPTPAPPPSTAIYTRLAVAV